ncbi:hypothetical protein N656DRAFT_777675 [Canariomyces notabilis]|uniref:Uncharacterized protein n=1 Tax=Canariomyces notabilis TaxID=2074819 RepID=A0AAN6YTL2_9PEZI|nr:hypothetical protein N656DRAFT_777675 [Canariomyces arenarius]
MSARDQVSHLGGRPRPGPQRRPRQPVQQEHWRGPSASGHAHMQNGHRSLTQTTNQPTYTYSCPQYYVYHINLSLPVPMLSTALAHHDYQTPYFPAGTSSNLSRGDLGHLEFLHAATRLYPAPLPSATVQPWHYGNREPGFANVGATAVNHPSVNTGSIHPGQSQGYWYDIHQPSNREDQSGQGRPMNPGGRQ